MSDGIFANMDQLIAEAASMAPPATGAITKLSQIDRAAVAADIEKNALMKQDVATKQADIYSEILKLSGSRAANFQQGADASAATARRGVEGAIAAQDALKVLRDASGADILDVASTRMLAAQKFNEATREALAVTERLKELSGKTWWSDPIGSFVAMFEMPALKEKTLAAASQAQVAYSAIKQQDSMLTSATQNEQTLRAVYGNKALEDAATLAAVNFNELGYKAKIDAATAGIAQLEVISKGQDALLQRWRDTVNIVGALEGNERAQKEFEASMEQRRYALQNMKDAEGAKNAMAALITNGMITLGVPASIIAREAVNIKNPELQKTVFAKYAEIGLTAISPGDLGRLGSSVVQAVSMIMDPRLGSNFTGTPQEPTASTLKQITMQLMEKPTVKGMTDAQKQTYLTAELPKAIAAQRLAPDASPIYKLPSPASAPLVAGKERYPQLFDKVIAPALSAGQGEGLTYDKVFAGLVNSTDVNVTKAAAEFVAFTSVGKDLVNINRNSRFNIAPVTEYKVPLMVAGNTQMVDLFRIEEVLAAMIKSRAAASQKSSPMEGFNPLLQPPATFGP